MAVENILTRTSVRSYLSREVEEQKTELLLRAAMSAPSGHDRRPWAFVVVNYREMLNRLAAALPNAKMLTEAPMAIIVCGDLTRVAEGEGSAYWIQDCSAAAENILLAAHALGLGAVWTGVYPKMQRVNAVKEILGMPEHIMPLNVIPIGYPKEQNVHKEKWDPGNIHYNLWGKQ